MVFHLFFASASICHGPCIHWQLHNYDCLFTLSLSYQGQVLGMPCEEIDVSLPTRGLESRARDRLDLISHHRDRQLQQCVQRDDNPRLGWQGRVG